MTLPSNLTKAEDDPDPQLYLVWKDDPNLELDLHEDDPNLEQDLHEDDPDLELDLHEDDPDQWLNSLHTFRQVRSRLRTIVFSIL